MRKYSSSAAKIVFLFSCLFLWACSGKNPVQADLVLLYTTDTHGHLAGDHETIGIDTLAAIRQNTPNALLLDAGDFLHGTFLATKTQGKTVIALMKKAGYFAAAAGNHEFDYGKETLLHRVEEAGKPPESMHILSANILDEEGKEMLTPWVATWAGDTKVCVFGLTTPETPKQTKPSHVTGLRFTDPLSTAKSLVKDLQDSGCGLILALVHLGSDSFMSVSSVDLGREVPGIDVILDGHSHLVLDRRTPHGGFLVSSGEHGKTLGQLSLFLDPGTGAVRRAENRFLKPEDVRGLAPDSETRKLLEHFLGEQEALFSEEIAWASKEYPADKRLTRTRETALGNLCADALRDAGQADMALINSGAIRGGIKKGRLALKDLFNILPFDGEVIRMELSGKEVRALLEHGFSRLPQASGSFPQISGMKLHLDMNRPAGQRIVSITLAGGLPMETDRVYRVAVNDFIAEGGDGYPRASDKMKTPLSVTAVQALENRIRKKGLPVEDSGERIVFTRKSSIP